MGHGPRYRMPLRRRHEGKTDYRHRLRLIKSGKPRIVVRTSNKNVQVQIVRYVPEGDHVLLTVTSKHLEDFGWTCYRSNIPASYLTGYLAGKRALDSGIKEAVLDIGMKNPHYGGKLFSTLKGVVDAGMDIPHDTKVLPDDERAVGKHMNEKCAKEFKDVKKKLEAL